MALMSHWWVLIEYSLHTHASWHSYLGTNHTTHTHTHTHTWIYANLWVWGAINLTDTPTLKCGHQNAHWQAHTHTHIYKVTHRYTCIHTHTTHTHTSWPANTLRKVEPFADFAYNSRKMTGNCWRKAELADTLYIVEEGCAALEYI